MPAETFVALQSVELLALHGQRQGHRDMTCACLPSVIEITYFAWTETFVAQKRQGYDLCLSAFSQWNYSLGMDGHICDKKGTGI